MTTSPVDMWEAEVNDLKHALGVANRERERLTREIVEAHRLVGSDGAHSALVSAIARLKKDNADLTLLLEGAKADRPLGLGALVLVRTALEAREEETTLDAARRVVNERDVAARVVEAAKAVAESRCEHNRVGLDCDVCRTARFIAKHVLATAEKG